MGHGLHKRNASNHTRRLLSVVCKVLQCTVLLMSGEESCSSCAVIRVNYFDVPILLCPEVKEQSKRGLRLLCSGCECFAPTVQCS